PLAGAGPAADLVQERALPLARGARPARGAGRVRRDAAGRHRDPRLGFHRRAALPRDPAAARRHRRLERGKSRGPGDARLHDRHRPRPPARKPRMSYLSHADLGGRDVPGAIIPEAEGDLFHGAWEPRALALVLAMGATGSWNIDIS